MLFPPFVYRRSPVGSLSRNADFLKHKVGCSGFTVIYKEMEKQCNNLLNIAIAFVPADGLRLFSLGNFIIRICEGVSN